MFKKVLLDRGLHGVGYPGGTGIWWVLGVSTIRQLLTLHVSSIYHYYIIIAVSSGMN